MALKRVQDQRNKHSGFVNNTEFVNRLSDLKNTAPCSAFRNLNVSERQRQALSPLTFLLNRNYNHNENKGLRFLHVFLSQILHLYWKVETKHNKMGKRQSLLFIPRNPQNFRNVSFKQVHSYFQRILYVQNIL